MIRFPIPPQRPIVLFTDLDGTLIDHHTYSADTARSALQLLERRGIPVIFCSSKTFAEQIHLQHELGLSQPFILENGSAIAVPKGYFPNFSPKTAIPAVPHYTKFSPSDAGGTAEYELFSVTNTDVRAIRAILAQFGNIRSYDTAADAELSAATGLSGEALQRARQRWFTETLLTPPDAPQVSLLQNKLTQEGWAISRGGRFYTVQPAQADKGQAVRWLKEIFRRNMPDKPLFAATGDSPNDAPMLAEADIPFLVKKHNGTWEDIEVPGLIKVEGIGPAGFSIAVEMLLGESATRW